MQPISDMPDDDFMKLQAFTLPIYRSAAFARWRMRGTF